MKRLIISFIAILNFFISFSQNSKNVLGTFAVACKVYNYEFRKMSNGLYSFRIEDVDKEGSRIAFPLDSIGQYKENFNKILTNLDTLSLLLSVPDSIKTIRHDSINSLINKYQSFLERIAKESSISTFWKSSQDSIKVITNTFNGLNLYKYDSLITIFQLQPILKELNTKLEEILKNIVSESTAPQYYTLNDLSQESFVQLFSYLLNKRKIYFLPECSSQIDINTLAVGIFYQIKIQLEALDDEPATAYIKLKNQTITCYYSEKSKIRSSESENIIISNKFVVDNVSIEFEDGNIKNIFADLNVFDIPGNSLFSLPIRFKNTIPITVSSRNDKDNFSSYNIYVSDLGGVNSKLILKNVNSSDSLKLTEEKHDTDATKRNIDNIYFRLSDLIDYIDILEVNKEDYSPANSVINLNKSNPIQELKKEKRSKILSVRAFTDFIGINDNEPNGLIQIEASKKFILSTKKTGSKNFYVGVFNYLEPRLIFSKIEENNNMLLLSDLAYDFLQYNSKVFHVNEIDLLKYQNLAFDTDLNVGKYNFPNIKSNIQVNASLGIFNTLVVDSIDVVNSLPQKSQNAHVNGINTFRFGWSLLYEIKPENRYGITLGYDFRGYEILYPDLINRNDLVHSFWIDAFLKLGLNDTIFFRYKYSFTAPAYRESFVQIQLGYLFDLFKINK